MKKAKRQMDLHDMAGTHFEIRDMNWNLPGSLTALLFAGAVPFVTLLENVECGEVGPSAYVSFFGFIITGIFTNVNNKCAFAPKSSAHYQYTAKYSKFLTELQTELARKPRFRKSAAVFMESVQNDYDNLVDHAPPIPPSITSKYDKQDQHDFVVHCDNDDDDDDDNQ